MNYVVFAKTNKHRPRSPVVLQPGEIEDYDFSACADQIFAILQTLESCHLIRECPYANPKEVVECIDRLIGDIDLESDEHQISEHKFVRIEYLDELLAVEVFVGV